MGLVLVHKQREQRTLEEDSSTVSVTMCHSWKLLGGLHWGEPARKSMFYEARNGTASVGRSKGNKSFCRVTENSRNCSASHSLLIRLHFCRACDLILYNCGPPGLALLSLLSLPTRCGSRSRALPAWPQHSCSFFPCTVELSWLPGEQSLGFWVFPIIFCYCCF